MKQFPRVFLTLLGMSAMAMSHAAEFDDTARVISATPQVEQVNYPRQQCWTEYGTAPAQQPQQQQGSVAGAIIGGIAGGILGNQVGRGNGRVAATAIGAVTGAVVGDRIENSNTQQVAEQQPAQRCRMVDHWETRNNGYMVTYEYRGQTYSTVMPYQPGNRLPVRVSVTPRF